MLLGLLIIALCTCICDKWYIYYVDTLYIYMYMYVLVDSLATMFLAHNIDNHPYY